MSNPILSLEPETLWRYFTEISDIPRESYHEEIAVDFLKELAISKEWEYKLDDIGNIVIKVPASPGYENSPGLVLQGHIDMVCVKDDGVDHDFGKDPLKLIIKDGWVTADGTSLGADNGLGVAVSLALIDDDELVRPQMEILITVQEEVGLIGAFNLGTDMLSGKVLINLDAGEPSKPCIGAGGGVDTVFKINTPREKIVAGKKIRLSVSQLEGGHSGDIYWKRANAIKLLARVLFETENLNIRIASMGGGTKRNVIPSSAHVDLVVPDNEIEKLTQLVKKTEEISREEFYDSDPDIKIELLELDFESDSVIEKNTGVSIVRFLMAIHQGLASINPDMLRLSHQSCNLALIKDHGDHLKIPAFSRGNTHYAIQTMVSRIVAVGELAGAEIIHENSYPAWEMQKNSRLAELVNETHIELFDSPVDFVAGHGGLEAGVICDKYPDLDAICLCALIKEGHSTNERMCIMSVQKLYRFLQKLVTNIAMKY